MLENEHIVQQQFLKLELYLEIPSDLRGADLRLDIMAEAVKQTAYRAKFCNVGAVVPSCEVI